MRRTYIIPVLLFAIMLVCVSFLHASPLEASSPSTFEHTVKRGENIGTIAKKYDVSWLAILRENEVRNPNKIYVGQVLRIPQWSPYGSAETKLASQQSPELQKNYQFHVVEDGDTLPSIAVEYGIEPQRLARANRMLNTQQIQVGDRLFVPMSVSAEPIAQNDKSGKWIDVNLTTQRLVAYEGDKAVFSTDIASGEASTPTVTGQFNVWLRYEVQDMNGASIGYDYYIQDVPYVMYFHRGFAIHGAPWRSEYGVPGSHGCVNVSVDSAEWLFNWSTYGTLVDVHN